MHCILFFLSPQDILFVRHNLSLLNGPIAKMTGLVSVIFAELTILGKFSGPSTCQKVSEYDQEMPLLHTADQHTAP